MKPLARLPHAEAARIVGLLFDLDDTVLTHGVLTREAFDALWELHEAGVRLVAVTGRPSGWGEVLVRQWPIDGAVTENGSVCVVREAQAVRVTMRAADVELSARRARLERLVSEIAEAMPRVRLAGDNLARRTDVTWDIGEADRLPPDAIAELEARIAAAGARTTRSSVHVHASFEQDDKASGAVRFLCDRFGEDAGGALSRWAFVGDSGNDAACFAAFTTTFGVANVRAHASRMSVPPAWVASSERGAGFAEVARALLAARRGCKDVRAGEVLTR